MGAQTLVSSNVQMVEQLYEAFGRGDVAAVLGKFDSAIEWTSAEGSFYPGTFIGPDAVLQTVFARIGGEWDGFRVAPTEYLDAGDSIVALGRYTGSYRATGKSMDAAFAHVWGVRDGRIVRFRQYVDSRKMAEAL